MIINVSRFTIITVSEVSRWLTIASFLCDDQLRGVEHLGVCEAMALLCGGVGLFHMWMGQNLYYYQILGEGKNHPLTSYFWVPSEYQAFDPAYWTYESKNITVPLCPTFLHFLDCYKQLRGSIWKITTEFTWIFWNLWPGAGNNAKTLDEAQRF